MEVIGALWCLWDPNKQCLWDKVAHSYIGHRVRGSDTIVTRTTTASEDLRNLKGLLDDGILTEEEYQERRVRLLERL